MPERGLVTSKVRAYMEALSPAARAMLVRAMRTAEERGEPPIPTDILYAAVEGLDLGMEEIMAPVPVAAPTVAARAAAPVREGPPWRERVEKQFFAPLQPLLIDRSPGHKQPGRIARSSLAALWTWIARDLAPREVERALAADPHDPAADANPIARTLRREVTALMIARVRETESDGKGWQRLTVQIGGEEVARDLRDVLYVFQRDGAFLACAAAMPRAVSYLDANEPSPLLDLMRKTIDEVQLDAAFVGVMVLGRTTTPAVLATLACRLTGSVDPRLVAGSRYGKLIDVVISEADRLASQMQSQLGQRAVRPKAIQTLRDFHELVRQLSTAIQIDHVSAWHKRLGGARKALSDLIAVEIDNAPGLVRRSLRVEGLAGSFGSGFDADSCEDAEFALKLLAEARLASDSLALNELIARTRKTAEQTLEVVSAKLFADLKSNTAFDRQALVDAVDGAIRMSATMFGEDYAATLRKSRDLALLRPPARSAG